MLELSGDFPLQTSSFCISLRLFSSAWIWYVNTSLAACGIIDPAGGSAGCAAGAGGCPKRVGAGAAGEPKPKPPVAGAGAPKRLLPGAGALPKILPCAGAGAPNNEPPAGWATK